MPRINLLPWREEHRQQCQKEFLQRVLLSVLIGIILLIISGQFIHHQQNLQSARNTLIKNHIAQLDGEIQDVLALQKEREQLLDWINTVDTLQADRGYIVQLLNKIPQVMPSSIYLTKIQQQGRVLFIEGEAQNNQQISELMRKLAHIEGLHDPTLTDVSASSSHQNFNHFILQLQQIASPQKQGAL